MKHGYEIKTSILSKQHRKGVTRN